MYSSYILNSSFFISSFDPNCKDTWAPIPKSGDKVPIDDEIVFTFVKGEGSFLAVDFGEAVNDSIIVRMK